MNVNRMYILIGLIMMGLSGCAITDFDHKADFSKYRTFAWGKSEVDVSNPVYESDLITKRIQTAVEKEFAKRGVVESGTDPDFIVKYHTYTEEKKRSESVYPYRYGFYPYGFFPFAFGWRYPYYMGSPAQVTEYTEGTLILDMIDHRTGELVWRGSVSGNVEDTARLKKQVERAVQAIMKKYPVSPETPLDKALESEVIS